MVNEISGTETDLTLTEEKMVAWVFEVTFEVCNLHTHIHTHTHSHTLTHTHTCMHACMHACNIECMQVFINFILYILFVHTHLSKVVYLLL